MEKTLKDLLKLPLREKRYQNNYLYIADQNDIPICMLLPLNEQTYNNFDELKSFLVTALNNEWERQYGEPKRWIEKEDAFSCPECNTDDRLQGYAGVLFNHCPSCGVRLLSPEGE